MSKALNPATYALAGTEHAHQTALFIWASQNRQEYPCLEFMFAVPNGGQRSISQAASLVAEGVRKGAPDVILPKPVDPWHGLYIEMKRPKTKGKSAGRVDDDQKRWHNYLRAQGYIVAVCFTWDEAKDTVVAYLQGRIKQECLTV